MFRSFAIIVSLAFLLGCQLDSESRQPADISWAQGIVWYQIFPERFRNGAPENDPTVGEVPEADLEPGWRVHPWTSDWYKLQPWELARSPNFYDVVFTRRYGGDLIGVIEKLDYLKELGIEAIYFNPVFEAPSLHKYDGASFHHIDDNFGPNPKRDKSRLARANETEDPNTWVWTSADSTFLQLIREAHKRGIRVVIDGVFNHSGRSFFAFQDIIKNGARSRYVHWYHILSFDDPDTPRDELDYKAWWGVKSLPEFAEDSTGLVSGPREYIFAITRRWMDPNGDGNPVDGIDGWRLDVINEVAAPFWQEWYALVKSVNPAAITVAEIWGDATPWIRGKQVDATMNYLFAKAVTKFFVDRRLAISGQEFAAELGRIQTLYGGTLNILWNLLDSHDTDRLASMVLNPDRPFDSQNSPRNNPGYQVRKPLESEKKIQKQIVAFQMCFPGAPLVYYGDEAGMWGADDPDDRKPMMWPEMQFEPESTHPLPGRDRPTDSLAFDANLFDFYKTLIGLRRQNVALRRGDYQPLTELISTDVFAFSRTYADQQVLAFFNRADVPVEVDLKSVGFRHRRYRDALSGRKYSFPPNAGTLQIAGRGFVLLASE